MDFEREGNVLDDLRSDDLAGTAPGGEEVDDHEALLAESGIEVGLAINRKRVSFSARTAAMSLEGLGRAQKSARKARSRRLTC